MLRSKRFRSGVSWGALVLFLAVWAMFLRPQFLGGPATFVGVSGVSMSPTMHDGDMALVTKRSSYGPGDIVAYRIPAGEPGAGSNIIHRITAGDGASGFVTRGDYNTWDDTWRPTEKDVIGEVWVNVPNLAGWLGTLRQPMVLAGFAGVVTFVIMLWPRRRKDDQATTPESTPEAVMPPAATPPRELARAGVAVAVTVGARTALRSLNRR